MSQLAKKTPVIYESTTQFSEIYPDTNKTFTFGENSIDTSFYFINREYKYVLRYYNWFDDDTTMDSDDEIPLLGMGRDSSEDLLFGDFKRLPEMKGALIMVSNIKHLNYNSQLEDITLYWFKKDTFGGMVVMGWLEFYGSPLIKVEKNSQISPNFGMVTIDMVAILKKFPQWAYRKDTLESSLLTLASIIFKHHFNNNAED